MIKKTSLTSFILLLLFQISAFAQQAHFNVEPGTNVEVGEKVYFSALTSSYASVYNPETNPDPLIKAVFEWDFGDGYSLKWSDRYRGGATVIHFFMKPGTYDVTLTMYPETDASHQVVGTPTTYTRTITVTGEEIIEDFEFRHGTFHARTAQYLKFLIPENYRNNSSRLEVNLIETNSAAVTPLFDRTNLSEDEIYLFDQTTLAAGDYVISAELFNASNARASVIREKFHKGNSGTPDVGIDENKSIVRNNSLFFPVESWQLDRTPLKDWLSAKTVNACFMEGYSNPYNVDSWKNYVEEYMEPNNLAIVGEDRWLGKWGFPPRTNSDINNLRNSDIRLYQNYVDATKSSPSMLAWCAEDEPNMGGWYNIVNAPTLAAWTEKIHKWDPNHPVVFNSYKYDYLPMKGTTFIGQYTYMYSENEYGGKKHMPTDILHGPIFIYGMGKRIFMRDPNDPQKGPMACYMETLENIETYNDGFITNFSFNTPTRLGINAADQLYWPIPKEVRLTSWLPVIHNTKGLAWFRFFGEVPPENYGAMAEFKAQIEDLTDVVLKAEPNPPITVSDNSNEYGNSVDVMTREHNGYIYIFTARVTEPYYFSEITEPQIIETEFTINGRNTSDLVVTEYLDHHRVYGSYGSETGQTETSFTLEHIPVVPGTFIAGGYYNDNGINKYRYAFDDGTGNIYCNKGYTQSGTWEAGTINYETGEVTVSFVTRGTATQLSILPGKENIRATWSVPSKIRASEINNGSFSDYFHENDVHIYVLKPASEVSPEYIRDSFLDDSPNSNIYDIRHSTNVEGFPIDGVTILDTTTTETDEDFILHDFYPNPMTNETRIPLDVFKTAYFKLDVMNIHGQHIRNIQNGELVPGRYNLEWDGKNENGSKVAKGTYLVTIQINNVRKLGKIVMFK